MAFLVEACGVDSDLLREVGSLLVAHEQGRDQNSELATEMTTQPPGHSVLPLSTVAGLLASSSDECGYVRFCANQGR
jgi:hypothetical protein